jgi:hypothetical protein
MVVAQTFGNRLSAGRAADALIRNANISWAEVLNQRELLAENAKLRATAHQLRVENTALRKKKANRLGHRILDRAKRYGEALLAVGTAVDGDSRSLRPVVVRSLVAAGILLTPKKARAAGCHRAGFAPALSLVRVPGAATPCLGCLGPNRS